MRAIAFLLAAISSAFVSHARADGCQAALAAFNNTANAANAAYAARLRQMKGFGTPAMMSECPKVIALMQSRIADAQRIQPLEQQAPCPVQRNPVGTSGATGGLPDLGKYQLRNS